MSIRTDRNQVFENGILVSEQIVEVDTTLETNELGTRTKAEQAIDGLKSIANSSGTLTGLQLSNAVRLLAKVSLHLIRMSLNKHDVTE